MSLILTAPYQRSKTYLDWYPGRIVLVCNREEHKLGSIDRCHDGLTWLILERGMNQDYHLPRFMTMCVLLSRATFAHRRVKKNRVRAWICNFISTVGHFRYLSFCIRQYRVRNNCFLIIRILRLLFPMIFSVITCYKVYLANCDQPFGGWFWHAILKYNYSIRYWNYRMFES